MRWIALLGALALFGCSDRTAAPIIPDALNFGLNKTVFIGTTRAINEAGEFGIGRSETLSLIEATVSIPPERSLGTVSDGFDKPKPERDFALAEMSRFASAAGFSQRLSQEIKAQARDSRDVVVFVHGFNNSFSDSAFRMAQLAHDLELPGAHVSYSWPSRGNPLGYEYDRDSALFARDGLADLLVAIRAAGQPNIIVVAHSMGSALVMETFRQREIADPGWVGRNIDGVILMSPDVNIDVFRSQFERIQTIPDPFVVFVSRKDAVLRLSSRLRGQKTQLGNIQNADAIADLPITVVDVSAFSDRRSGNHFVAGSSPALIQLMRRSSDLDREFLRGRTGATVLLPGQRRIFAPVSAAVTSQQSAR
ncbi:alpha/beta fold hydrolase [uncultured Tateyamaria sp.]|uniref:alpha/beta hydrolase n=1 Tax=uncultured Tateyamaria sp. TaxID=455651 RepID=UPI002601811F|nr:alpha/beta fold hydrolase [uncultured Tateyamaria sp.]